LSGSKTTCSFCGKQFDVYCLTQRSAQYCEHRQQASAAKPELEVRIANARGDTVAQLIILLETTNESIRTIVEFMRDLDRRVSALEGSVSWGAEPDPSRNAGSFGFKAGDRVIDLDQPILRRGRITEVMQDGDIGVQWDSGVHSYTKARLLRRE